MVRLRAKLYQVALVRWADVPKVAVDKLKLTPADIKGAIKGWTIVAVPSWPRASLQLSR